MQRSAGQSTIEFGIMLPFIAFAVLSIVCIGIACIKGEVLTVAAFESSEDLAVFLSVDSPSEHYASIAPGLTDDLRVEHRYLQGISNTSPGLSSASSSFIVPSKRFDISRSSKIVPGIHSEISDEILRGGDTPSPFCKNGEVWLCGYR